MNQRFPSVLVITALAVGCWSLQGQGQPEQQQCDQLGGPICPPYEFMWWSWWQKPTNTTPNLSGVKFIYPLQGRIIEHFGPDKLGHSSDGINIAADKGTPIRAAAAGTVTFAGNELKDYGNLILIKHANGYVTAYAHVDSIRVKRGDVVASGQVIGTVGDTGNVDTPQLHFEIRHGTQALDPEQLLPRQGPSKDERR